MSCEYVPPYLFLHVVSTKITTKCPLGYSVGQETILCVCPTARYVIHLHTYNNNKRIKRNLKK